MGRWIAAAAVALAARGAAAQAPVVNKVEPPNWWVGHSINPVRVLLRGEHLGGATVRCGALRCAVARVSASGTHAFVDVTVPKGLAPGAHPIEVRTAAGTVQAPFAIEAPLARAGRFQGFGASDVIYLIMTDRFANGDPGNDNPAVSPGLTDRSNPRYYHGGDLAGIRKRLPYLKELGITAIWITPVYDNQNTPNEKQAYQGKAITDYHGYGATDLYGLEEHFGDVAELKRLTDEAHAAGIKLILDMVANHTGPDHPWVKDAPTPTWLNGTPASHLNNTWQVWSLADPHGTDATRAGTLSGWFADVLPDLNQDDPEVARYLIQNTMWWTAKTGIDGIRQDTWPYVPRSFWKPWTAAIKREYPAMRIVGEVWDGDPTVTSFFEGPVKQFDGVATGVDALFDFPLHYPMRRAFAEGRSLREVVQMLGRDHLYQAPDRLVTFLGLHDVSRFMNDKGATTDGLMLGFTFLMTARGTPMIYYGDEIGLPGAGDPDNRRDFPGGWAGDARDGFTAAGRTADEQRVFAHVQALLKLRAARPELSSARMETLAVTEQVFAYRRGATTVVLNNGTAPAEVRVPVALRGASVLGACGSAVADRTGSRVTIPARSGCIF
jgi:glycosidase